MNSTNSRKFSILTELVFIDLAEVEVILIAQIRAPDHRQHSLRAAARR